MSTGAVSKKIKLDKIDRKILSDLQAHGRMTNVDLADRAGISAPPCLRRVRSLEENKVILGYYANLNATKLGFGVTSFSTVKLINQSDVEVRKFEEKIAEWDNVREAYIISGDYDFMLRVVAENWEEYQNFLTNELMKITNVASVRSSLNVRTSKFCPGVPLSIEG